MQLINRMKSAALVSEIGPFQWFARAACVSFLCLMLASCGRATPVNEAIGKLTEIGYPEAGHRPIRVLDNQGFMIGYDTAMGQPAWVVYRLTPVHGYRRLPRPSFAPDPRLDHVRGRSVYDGPAYDRGHLAPNYAISQRYGKSAQRQTFYYSNIAPQTPRLNQLVWQRLEEIEIDDIATRTGELWVMVGPIPARHGGPPTGFYRIWAARSPDVGWQTLAFRVGQNVRGDERLDSLIVSIDEIERATGLDFLAAFPKTRQRALESSPGDAQTFDFAAHACQPARYGQRWQGRDGIRLRYDRCGATAHLK